MATSKKTSGVASTTEKLTISERNGVVFLDSVRVKQNVKGTDYIATPFGAVYSRLKEIKPGLHAVVTLSNGMLALNDCTREEKLAFINAKLAEFPNYTVEDIKAEFGL